MKHKYDQNVHIHFGQQVLDYMKIFSLLYVLRLKELLALPKMIDQLSELFAQVLPPFDHRLMSHDTKFSILAHIEYAHYFLEQSKSPFNLFNFFKKLPIIQKIFHEYLAQAYCETCSLRDWMRVGTATLHQPLKNHCQMVYHLQKPDVAAKLSRLILA